MTLSQWKTTYAFPSWCLCLLRYCVVSCATQVMGKTCRTYGARDQNGTQKMSLAFGIHCCPISFYISCPAIFSVLRITCEYIHMSDCVENVYELPLLPNSTASETSLYQSGEVRSVDWIFIIESPAWRWLGNNVILDKSFTIFFCNTKQ